MTGTNKDALLRILALGTERTNDNYHETMESLITLQLQEKAGYIAQVMDVDEVTEWGAILANLKRYSFRDTQAGHYGMPYYGTTEKEKDVYREMLKDGGHIPFPNDIMSMSNTGEQIRTYLRRMVEYANHPPNWHPYAWRRYEIENRLREHILAKDKYKPVTGVMDWVSEGSVSRLAELDTVYVKRAFVKCIEIVCKLDNSGWSNWQHKLEYWLYKAHQLGYEMKRRDIGTEVEPVSLEYFQSELVDYFRADVPF